MSAYMKLLDEAVAALEQEAKALRASGRRDEADLVRIRINIHRIAGTIYQVCLRSSQGEALREAFLKKLDALPENWRAARELALAHDDQCRVVIEDIKLDTLAGLRARYLETEGL